MRILRVCLLPVVLAVSLFLALSTETAFSAAAKKPAPPPDMRKMIQSVNAASGSVVIVYMDTKQTHTYRIDDNTALKVNGVPGKIADIKPGMVVTDYLERDNDDLDGLTLTGYGTTASTGTKTPAKKK